MPALDTTEGIVYVVDPEASEGGAVAKRLAAPVAGEDPTGLEGAAGAGIKAGGIV